MLGGSKVGKFSKESRVPNLPLANWAQSEPRALIREIAPHDTNCVTVCLVSQFEHTVIVIKDGCEIITE